LSPIKTTSDISSKILKPVCEIFLNDLETEEGKYFGKFWFRVANHYYYYRRYGTSNYLIVS